MRKSDYDANARCLKGGIKTEAGMDRIVTISPKVQKYIDTQMEGTSDYMFPNNEGKKFSLHVYRDCFYEALAEMGIQPLQESGFHRLTPHSCRHTFATLMKRVSAPDKDKLELIGHAYPKMLMYYQDVSVEDLRKITDLV
jgi:integrase